MRDRTKVRRKSIAVTLEIPPTPLTFEDRTFTRGDITVLEQLSKRASERISGEVAITIPWDQILELALQLIQQCMENRKTFLSAAKAPTFVQKAALNIAIRRVIGVTNRRQVVAIQSAVLTTATEATDEELGQCHSEACEVLGIDYDHDPQE